ncbi:MAG: hypothetical protein WC662_00080 [Candidatus Paceibacterota bacterium]|jgi:hypothetical protein
MKTLIESCFGLSTKLLRNDLQKARNMEPIEGEYLNFIQNGKASVLDYSIEYNSDGNTYLVVNVDVEHQKILLSERELTYGTRTYLVCGCGARVNALYLKGTFFACRNCHNLQYKSTTVNNSSLHGRFLNEQSKRLKLVEMRAEMDRIFYKSKYTQRFTRFLKLCVQSGLLGPVRDADKTIKAINSSQYSQ